MSRAALQHRNVETFQHGVVSGKKPNDSPAHDDYFAAHAFLMDSPAKRIIRMQ